MKIEAVYRTIWRVTYPYLTYLLVSFLLMQTGMSNTLLLNLISGLFTLPFLFLYYYMDKRSSTVSNKNGCRFKRIRLCNYVYAAFMGMAACLALNYLIDILKLADISPAFRSTSGMFTEGGFVRSLIASGLVAPVMEELLYRGLIYKRLRESLDSIVSAVLSAIIFGAAHGNLVQFVYAFFAGLMMAYLYEKYKNLFAPVLFHFCANALSLTIMWNDVLKAENSVKPVLCILNVFILFVIFVLIEKNVKRELEFPSADEQGAI